jgi:integrase
MLEEIKSFIEGKEKRTQQTYSSYGKNLEEFLKRKNATLQTITPLQVKAFIYETGTDRKGALVMNTAASYKRFMATLLGSLDRKDVVEWLKKNTREIKRIDKFKVDLELWEILKFIDVTKQPTLKFAWSIMAFNDFRPGEALGLYYSDVDTNAKVVRLVRHEGERYFPKGMKIEDKAVTIPLNDFSAALFKQLPYRVNQRIVTISYETLRKWFKRYMTQAGITRTTYKLTPHKLRHFFAHYWRQNKGDLQILKTVMRHSDIRYTLLYSEPSEAETTEEFKKVMHI